MPCFSEPEYDTKLLAGVVWTASWRKLLLAKGVSINWLEMAALEGSTSDHDGSRFPCPWWILLTGVVGWEKAIPDDGQEPSNHEYCVDGRRLSLAEDGGVWSPAYDNAVVMSSAVGLVSREGTIWPLPTRDGVVTEDMLSTFSMLSRRISSQSSKGVGTMSITTRKEPVE